jgi:hypothetical protein
METQPFPAEGAVHSTDISDLLSKLVCVIISLQPLVTLTL